MSAVGTIPLQNPGWNEGKARNETLGYAGVSPLQGSSTSSLSLYYFNALALLGRVVR